MKNKQDISLIFICLIILISNVDLYCGVTVIGSLTHEIVLTQGKSHTGQIALKNSGPSSQLVEIFQTDYSSSSAGKSSFQEPAGQMSRSNAHWIKYTPSRIRIAPESEALVQFKITVPEVDTLHGTYWSILMIKEIPEIDPDDDNEGFRINTVMQYSNQIITHVGTYGPARLEFYGAQVIKEGGERNIQIDIKNVGDKLLRPDVWIEIYDHMGGYIGKYTSKIQRIFPGCSKRKTINISKLEKGEYKTVVVADCGFDDLFGVEYTIKIE